MFLRTLRCIGALSRGCCWRLARQSPGVTADDNWCLVVLPRTGVLAGE